MESLLKLCNDQYNFKTITDLANGCALDLIFYTHPENEFGFTGCSQSEIYMRCLKVACLRLGWSAFYEDFVHFLEEESLKDYSTFTGELVMQPEIFIVNDMLSLEDNISATSTTDGLE